MPSKLPLTLSDFMENKNDFGFEQPFKSRLGRNWSVRLRCVSLMVCFFRCACDCTGAGKFPAAQKEAICWSSACCLSGDRIDRF
jgi:hypothetical protein